MKQFLLPVLLLIGISAFAQQDKIKQMEENLRDLSGPARVQLLLSISEAYLKNGQPDKAIDYAEQAGAFAKKINEPELRATALNREGRLMVQQGKRKSAAKFEQSLKILSDLNSGNKPLAIDNLENLKTIAEKAREHEEVVLLNARITRLKNGGSLADAPGDGKNAMQQELTAVQQQLAANQNAFKASQMKLLEESQVLQKELADREAEIDRMTQEQMKTAMLVMQQRVLLDSISYKAGLDSLTVTNANLALREAESNRKFNYAIMGVLLLLAGGSTFSFIRARQNAKVLEEKNSKGLISPKDYQTQGEALAKKEEAINKYAQEVDEKLAAKREELYKPILEKVNTAMQTVAKENGRPRMLPLHQPPPPRPHAAVMRTTPATTSAQSCHPSVSPAR